MVGILYYIRRLKLVGEEDEKLRDSAIETKKGRSAIAVAAQITTDGSRSLNSRPRVGEALEDTHKRVRSGRCYG